MAAGNDVREILELSVEVEPEHMTKEAIIAANTKKKTSKKPESTFKKPEGMHREVWGLLFTDRDGAPPIVPTDTNKGYKQMKAKIGRSQVRPWRWTAFTNPARKDGAMLYHWRRVADEGTEYPFARFNKTVDMPSYSDLEYQQHLHSDTWTRQETDHLFDLCKRFDCRFVIVHDRWDKERYPNRSVEDIKERYYGICHMLLRVRAPIGTEPKIKAYDADHERRRKRQLDKLYNRTQEQVEEEETLIQELKKIELRKKEREKKTQDLQKLITAADTSFENRKMDKKLVKKKIPILQKMKEGVAKMTPDMTGIKFPDLKVTGVYMRSQRMKLPLNVGQKKTKAIEQVLEELGIEFNPIPTEEMVQHFNDLRQDIVLLYELKLALSNCEYELQTLKHRHDTSASTPKLKFDDSLLSETSLNTTTTSDLDLSHSIDTTIDVVTTHDTPRKRKAAIEQANIIKKLKERL